MKKLTQFVAAALLLMFADSAGLAQEIKAKTDKAATIYVAPLQFYKYYGIKMIISPHIDPPISV